jgi:hypothetical protein
VLSLDTVKLADDAALDGYWLLHTSRVWILRSGGAGVPLGLSHRAGLG